MKILLDLAKLSKLMVMLTEPQRPWPGQLRLVRDWYQPHLERMHEHDGGGETETETCCAESKHGNLAQSRGARNRMQDATFPGVPR